MECTISGNKFCINLTWQSSPICQIKFSANISCHTVICIHRVIYTRIHVYHKKTEIRSKINKKMENQLHFPSVCMHTTHFS